jgi:hypothetical protein
MATPPLPFESDPELLALLDGPAPTSPLAPLCAMMGVPVAFYWLTAIAGAASRLFPRVSTGYMPEDQRRNVRYRRHCDGLHFNRGEVAA